VRADEYNIQVVLILALDTTTRDGSVALVRDGVVLTELTGDGARTHAERLPQAFVRACETAGVQLSDVDLLAVAAGPGSFTGLRVGIAAMQGLAFAHRKKVVPVMTLEAIAEAVEADGRRIAAWMDAQRGEVFAALYERRAGEGAASPLFDATSGTPEDILSAWLKDMDLRGVQFHGDGAVRYSPRIRTVLGEYVHIATEVPPLAAAIGRIAAREPQRAVSPHAIVPVYVRRPDAELARDRRAGSA
jgi:tRNA threonylcarbamoyladenosine biosynthesis protein TsaB